ncbi:major facilitator superfamily domain-containing protein [Camillea tinctor]|nr:major facilitator superfamily domain-containing protein [Camillea tinctor]
MEGEEEGEGSNRPWGLYWRSNTSFILSTVTVGMFTDLFLYGLVVPVLPFMLRDRLAIPENEIQSYVSNLLAAYAGASVVSSLPAGWIADKLGSRQAPFLGGLGALLAATIMLAFGRKLVILVIARLLQGMSAAVVWTVGLAMVIDTVGPQDIGKVIGLIFSFISIGGLMSPVIGGILYEKTGYVGVFGIASSLLGLDFLMRLVVIEKKTAAKFDNDIPSNPCDFWIRDEGVDAEATEEDALVPKSDDSTYKFRGEQSKAIQSLPILACFKDLRFLMTLLLAFVQALLLSAFDATVPTEAQSLFDFSSLEAGLLFIALDMPYLVLGPLCGWAVDRYGTKLMAVMGFGYMAPALVVLRLVPDELVSGTRNVVFYCALLALNGIGLAAISSPSIVEASSVVQRYEKANPGFFGENGPYAQLYGFNSIFYNAGLATGPILAGYLKGSLGYGNMNLVFAVISGITATLSFFIVGGKRKVPAGT